MKVFQASSLVTAIALCFGMAGQSIAVADDGSATVATPGPLGSSSMTPQEMADALPYPLPTIDIPPTGLLDHLLTPPQLNSGQPGVSLGSPSGVGPFSDESLPEPAIDVDALMDNQTELGPDEYGTAQHPYTTERVDNKSNYTSRFFPYAAAGKLYFKKGNSSFVCSGALVKRGVVVTAAHCVTEFGGNWYSSFEFAPAQHGSKTPYTVWEGYQPYVMSSYKNGTDSCAVSGVVCQNDVAVIVLKYKKYQGSNVFPGQFTGWLGYGWNGYGFTDQNLVLINQLGYPVSHDSGKIMQRTDSQGYTDSNLSNNTVWGTRQTGGSSGGPEVINLGISPQLSSGAPLGSFAGDNIVVGVTSWGYTDPAVKQQGASPFTSNNITKLVDAACNAYPMACQ